MPSSDATNFSVPSVGFFLKVSNPESFDDSGEPFTSGDTDDVDHFVLGENLVRFDFFFEEVGSEIYFFSDGSSVDLDFVDVVFFLS